LRSSATANNSKCSSSILGVAEVVDADIDDTEDDDDGVEEEARGECDSKESCFQAVPELPMVISANCDLGGVNLLPRTPLVVRERCRGAEAGKA
jgi:hypothetical protein